MEEVTETAETKEPSLKDLYEAVIELTKEVGKIAAEQSELRKDLALKKKAGNF
jgi:hypothetical protein